MTVTDLPLRARNNAALSPAGPSPTTMTSGMGGSLPVPELVSIFRPGRGQSLCRPDPPYRTYRAGLARRPDGPGPPHRHVPSTTRRGRVGYHGAETGPRSGPAPPVTRHRLSPLGK